MKENVLITGASSGIGYSMAKQLAAKGYNLIITARSANKLQELKDFCEQQHGVQVHIFVTDLAVAGNAAKLYADVKQANLPVNMLVNNAGVGVYGSFADTPLEDDLKMLELNINALVVLTKLYAADMKKAGKGKIQNVASLLSFLPFPYYSVYSATKAFVLAFTETIAAELEDSGVTVTALCPGPTDTAFTTTEMLNTNAYKTNKPMNTDIVAKMGVDLLLNGKGKKIAGFQNWFISNLPRVTPDFIMMKIKKNLASQVR